MSYITVADLRQYIGTDSTADDVVLTTCINNAQAIIDRHCRRTFEATADTTRHFDALRDVDEHGITLYLDADLCQITSITNGDGTSVSGSAYTTEPRNRTPWHALTMKSTSSVVWTFNDAPEDAITIVGRWAWSLEAPDDIVQACLRLASWLYKQRDNLNDQRNEGTTRSESGLIFIPAKLPSDVQEMLKHYRRK